MTISVILFFLSFCSFLCFLGTRAAKIQNPSFRPLPGLKKNVGAPVLPPTLRSLLLTASEQQQQQPGFFFSASIANSFDCCYCCYLVCVHLLWFCLLEWSFEVGRRRRRRHHHPHHLEGAGPHDPPCIVFGCGNPEESDAVFVVREQSNSWIDLCDLLRHTIFLSLWRRNWHLCVGLVVVDLCFFFLFWFALTNFPACLL